MAEQRVEFGKTAGEQIVQTVRESMRRMRNEAPQYVNYTGGKNGTACPNRYVFEHLGNPTGGTSTIELYGTYRGVALAEDMTAVIDWDATATEIKTALETANGYDPEADPVEGFAVTVGLGPLPNNDITITLPAGVHVRTIDNDLTPAGIQRYAKVRSCCGG